MMTNEEMISRKLNEYVLFAVEEDELSIFGGTRRLAWDESIYAENEDKGFEIVDKLVVEGKVNKSDNEYYTLSLTVTWKEIQQYESEENAICF